MTQKFKKDDAVTIKPKFAKLASPDQEYNPKCFWFIFNVKKDTCTIYARETKAVGGTRRVYLKNIKLDWIKEANQEYTKWVNSWRSARAY